MRGSVCRGLERGFRFRFQGFRVEGFIVKSRNLEPGLGMKGAGIPCIFFTGFDLKAMIF